VAIRSRTVNEIFMFFSLSLINDENKIPSYIWTLIIVDTNDHDMDVNILERDSQTDSTICISTRLIITESD